ncbi:IS3 family transposase [Enterococcus sp. AZ128]|uniref:IS3 family transposase n=1 Tax=unclassified Enterococcus TaxID=2608891 RepID=UPI003F689724
MRQESEAGHHSVVKMCQLLDVPRATYYRKINPIPTQRIQKQELRNQRVFRLYHESDRIYGAGKIRYLLTQNFSEYRKISIKRVQKSMKRQGIRSVSIKKFKAAKRILKNYPNLLKQDFSTTALNQKWVADITYINTLEDDWCYLSTIMDLHSRKIIGYHFDQQMTTDIVEKALDEAVLNRNSDNGLILHTDLGSQYTSNEYEEKLNALNISHSYIRKGCPYDNAGIESFHALLKKNMFIKDLFIEILRKLKLKFLAMCKVFTITVESIVRWLICLQVNLNKPFWLLNIKNLSQKVSHLLTLIQVGLRDIIDSLKYCEYLVAEFFVCIMLNCNINRNKEPIKNF